MKPLGRPIEPFWFSWNSPHGPRNDHFFGQVGPFLSKYLVNEGKSRKMPGERKKMKKKLLCPLGNTQKWGVLSGMNGKMVEIGRRSTQLLER